ncbi:MAG: tRNA (adenosine(37)-N6)-dimethylallyltransferase MiaA [Gammaproteobacteria bacterium]|nr:tRNA (adenosine(37)-N6)-dimethylallyltransferase MiaA [Gammaproteobacteria bacterium]NNJ49164.1 tRNA (adenosine(37)-N6)-dimethylallyltransferase MiaA [Gammaproteobacteria bacterium]
MSDLIIQPGESRESPITIFIMGATATGKTDLAMAISSELREDLPCELISVDSALVYRGMDIGTAKPDAQTLKDFPHHLIDMIDPAEVYSAGQFRQDALRLMQKISDKWSIPVLVGGTMLYFNTLQKGMADMPEVSDKVKKSIEAEARTDGIGAMHQRLKSIDPVSAERIHPNDPQRIKRALELFDFTGKTLTQFWQEQEQKQLVNCFPYRRIKIALMPDDRVELRKRITKRFDMMLKQGFIEEVEALYNRGDLHAGMPSIRAVGYRQAWSYLAGEYDFDEMRDRAIIATAQLAKRQMTWLRKESDCNFIDPIALNTPKVLKNLKILLS